MPELIAKSACESACDGLLPLKIGGMQLTEADPGRLSSIAPYKGQEKALSGALKKAHGMALPAINRATGKEGARAMWFGQGQVLLVGPDPAPELAAHAAMTDQSDAWAIVRLDGDGAVDVLARLVPLDLRGPSFKRGHTARTQLGHMMVSVTKTAENVFQIMVFRSMAATLVHELKFAMQGVAARANL